MNKVFDRTQWFALALLASLYLWSGLAEKLFGFEATAAFVASRHLPWPALLVSGSLLVEVLVPLGLFARRTRAAAAILLALYTLATALLFHNFWRGDDAMHSQLQNFLKNFGLAGGFLYVFADACKRSLQIRFQFGSSSQISADVPDGLGSPRGAALQPR